MEMEKIKISPKQILNIAGVIIISLDLKGNITTINKYGCKLLGCPKKEILGKNWFDNFLPKTLVKDVKCVFGKMILGNLKLVEYYDNPVVTKKGEERIISWHNALLKNDKGKIIGVLSSGINVTDEKEKDKIVYESEKRYNDIVTHSSQLFYIHDTKHVLSYVSPQSKQMFGYTIKEMLINWTSLVTDNPINKIGFEKTVKAIKTGKRQNPYLLELKHKNGKSVFVEVNESPIKDKNGKVIGITGALVDITERRQVEMAHQKSEESYRLLADNIHDQIWTASMDGADKMIKRLKLYDFVKGIDKIDLKAVQKKVKLKITYITPSVKQSNGYTPEELIGTSVFKLIEPSYHEYVIKVFLEELINETKKNVKLNRSRTLEVEQVRKDGSVFWTEITTSFLRNKNNKPISILGVSRDITDRKKAEKALQKAHDELEKRVEERTSELRESEERLALATQVSKIGVWDWNIKTNVLIWDDAMYELYGVDKKDFSGVYEAWSSTLHPDDKTRAEKEVQLALKGKKEFNIDFRIIASDKTVRILNGKAIVHRDDNGKAIRMIGVNTDVTERKEVDRAKNEFVSIASHQLRTPLTGIKWLIQAVLKKGDLNKWQISFLQDALESNNRMNILVNDLLNISRLESGVIGVSPKKTDLCNFISELINSFKPDVDLKKLVIQFEKPKQKIEFSFDRELIGQVITNLFSNAVKYCDKEKPIIVSIKKLKNDVKISIQDNGIGILKEDQKRLYTKFFRTDRAMKVDTKGSGLGLYIVKKILDAHSGKIEVNSISGKGATFTITLPLKGAARKKGVKELIIHEMS